MTNIFPKIILLMTRMTELFKVLQFSFVFLVCQQSPFVMSANVFTGKIQKWFNKIFTLASLTERLIKPFMFSSRTLRKFFIFIPRNKSLMAILTTVRGTVFGRLCSVGKNIKLFSTLTYFIY